MAIPIRKKLVECNAIIENADKVISIITLYKQQFHEKIGFVNSSACSALNKKVSQPYFKEYQKISE